MPHKDPIARREYQRRYAAEHSEQQREHARSFYARHPEKRHEYAMSRKEQKRVYDVAYRARNAEHYRELNARWKQEHAEHVRECRRARYLAHREEIAAYNAAHREERSAYYREYRARDPQRHRARTRAWLQANHERHAAKQSRRRALALGAPGSHTTAEWRDKCALLGNVCFYCGEAKPLTRDHKIPLSRGGSDSIENIVPACKSCNCRKLTRTAQEFLAAR